MPFSVPESHSGYKTRLGYHVSLSSPWLCFSDLPCFWWLGEVLVRYFVKCLSMGIYICFLMISWGNVFFLKSIRLSFLYQKRILPIFLALLMLTLTPDLTGVCLVSPPHIHPHHSPFSYCTLRKEVTMHSSHLRSQLCCTSLREEYLCCWEYLCVRHLSFHHIYLRKHLFSSLWIFGYLLFKIGLYSPVLPYLFCCSNCFSVGC